MRRILLIGLVLATTPARAADIAITLDEVRTVTFGAPVTTVFVGNPAIADINMIDSRHAFVLGKGYGSTNIVALNHDGTQVYDGHVNVMAKASGQSTVVLNRGAERVTYSCTSDHCEITPQPGDGKAAYDEATGQISAHQDDAKKAAAQ